MSTTSRGLGKGLSALMAEDYSQLSPAPSRSDSASTVAELPINALTSGQFQPRTIFEDSYLNELADSIRSNGVMQPILVRELKTKKNGATYEIVAGERRWRASKLAGLTKVPVLIKVLEDNKALELALIENIQRQDLNALEEAEGYMLLIQRFSYTQEQLSKVVGKSRSHVANALRLLNLPEEIKNALNENAISAGHGRALLGCSQQQQQEYLAYIKDNNLNVRQTEQLVKEGAPSSLKPLDISNKPKTNALNKSSKSTSSSSGNYTKDPDLLALEETLSQHVGVPVEIQDNNGSGMIVLNYTSLLELDVILKRIGSL